MTTGDTNRRRRLEVIALGVAVLVAAAAGGVFLGLSVAADPVAEPRGESSVDAGFLRDMQPHHAQAVQMSVIVRDRTADEQVRTLALDIQLGQQHQIGQMYGRLASWGLPQTSPAPPMVWMMTNRDSQGSGNSHAPAHESAASATPMPGMATAADLRRLRGLRGRDAERLYLQLMIPHHQAGVDMAEYAAETAADPQVRLLARRIVDAQSAEIEALRAMLAARGGPLP